MKEIKSKKMKKRKKYEKKYFPNKTLNPSISPKEKILNFIRSMTYEPFEPPSFFIGSRKFYIAEQKLIKKNFLKSPK